MPLIPGSFLTYTREESYFLGFWMKPVPGIVDTPRGFSLLSDYPRCFPQPGEGPLAGL